MKLTVKIKDEEQPTRMDQLKGPHARSISSVLSPAQEGFVIEQVNKEFQKVAFEELSLDVQESIQETAYGDQI